MAFWWVFVALAGTPAPILARLNAEIGAILAQPEIKALCAGWGIEPNGGTVQAFGARIGTIPCVGASSSRARV